MFLICYKENKENCCQICFHRTRKNQPAKPFKRHIFIALILCVFGVLDLTNKLDKIYVKFYYIFWRKKCLRKNYYLINSVPFKHLSRVHDIFIDVNINRDKYGAFLIQDSRLLNCEDI